MRPTNFRLAGLASLTCSIPAQALKIAAALQVIEYTPLSYTIKNFYKDSATIGSGGVASLASDTTLDLGANAELQGLVQYGSHKNIRMIYTIVDVPYRIVANKESGVSTLADLKGKKIGTMPGTSAGYFVNKLLASAGLKDSDYTIVSGSQCMKAPCGAGTFPQMIKNKQIDAFGFWEPSVGLGVQALGDSAVVFQNATVFREIYSLFTTTQKLNDPASRKNIVNFIKALNQSIEVFNNQPDKVYQFAASAVGMDAATMQAVWPVHKWSGSLGTGMDSNLIDYMTSEDVYVASQNRRSAMSKADITAFVDTSVIEDAQKS